MRDVSVLTIARGREAHLHNVIRGLAAQTVPPRELVIAAMQDELYDGLPDVPFPIHQIQVTRPDGELPLAAARNAVAAGQAASFWPLSMSIASRTPSLSPMWQKHATMAVGW